VNKAARRRKPPLVRNNIHVSGEPRLIVDSLKVFRGYFSSSNLNSETDIKNLVTGGANKKPFGDITLLFEHRMETVFIST
jgi:hypothetical protein